MRALFLLCISFALISCEKAERPVNSVIGTWNCNEHSDQIGQRSYQVSIIRNPSVLSKDNDYVISNFHNIGMSDRKEVYVSEDPAGTLNITGTSAIGLSFSGKGIVTENYTRIVWEYMVNDGTNNTFVSALYY